MHGQRLPCGSQNACPLSLWSWRLTAAPRWQPSAAKYASQRQQPWLCAATSATVLADTAVEVPIEELLSEQPQPRPPVIAFGGREEEESPRRQNRLQLKLQVHLKHHSTLFWLSSAQGTFEYHTKTSFPGSTVLKSAVISILSRSLGRGMLSMQGPCWTRPPSTIWRGSAACGRAGMRRCSRFSPALAALSTTVATVRLEMLPSWHFPILCDAMKDTMRMTQIWPHLMGIKFAT